MTMIRKTITIPDAMEDWIKARIASGSYGNDSEYFRDLLRRDQERQEGIAQLRELLDEADQSGLSDRSPKEIMAAVKSRLKKDDRLPS